MFWRFIVLLSFSVTAVEVDEVFDESGDDGGGGHDAPDTGAQPHQELEETGPGGWRSRRRNEGWKCRFQLAGEWRQ